VLGPGPPHQFVVDLPAAERRTTPAALGALLAQAQTLLRSQKPVHTVAVLRLRSPGLRLAGEAGEVGAALGVDTVLWDEPIERELTD
jgi:hypothetical protein